MNLLPTTITPGLLDPMVNGQATATPNERQLEQVGEQFEAVFMSMLSKQLRESLEDGLFGGESSDTYGALFDMYMGQHLAQAGGIGVKQMLISQYAEASQAATTDSAHVADTPTSTRQNDQVEQIAGAKTS